MRRVEERPIRRIAALGVLGALLLLPLYPKVDLLSVPGTYIAVRPGDFIVALAVGLWAVTLLSERRRPVVPGLIAILLGAWVAIGFLALLVGALLIGSINLNTGFAFWVKPLEYYLLGLAVFDLVRVNALPLRRVGAVVAVAAAIVIAYALLERFGLLPHPPGRTVPAGGAISTIGDLHQLAAYLGIIAIVSVATWHRLGARAVRIAALLGLIGLVSVMAATGARSEFVALGLCLVLLAAWRPAAPAAAFAVALVVLFFALPLVAGLVPGLGPPGTDEQSVSGRMFGDSFDYSLDERMAKWRNFIDRATHSPLIGFGPSAATEAADGYYIRVLVETGLAGLAIFLGLLAAIARSLWRGARSTSGTARALAVGLLASTAYIALVGILIDTWVAARVMDLYWPLLGASLATLPPWSAPARSGPSTA